MNIALVEDDPIQRKPISAWLEEAGHQCQGFADCQSYLSQSRDPNDHDLLLLDWELPDSTGLELLQWLREQSGHSLPVMFLTRRDHEEDIVAALRSGADDYLIKPARRNELLARIEAVARRNGRVPASSSNQIIGPFEFDSHSRQVKKNGTPLSLTQKEFSLAHYLLSNLGKLITRDELLEKVWFQSASLQTRTVDTHISRLRRKLELIPEQGWHLSAVYQHGYRLDWIGEEPVSA